MSFRAAVLQSRRLAQKPQNCRPAAGRGSIPDQMKQFDHAENQMWPEEAAPAPAVDRCFGGLCLRLLDCAGVFDE
jgi:hypothetical protein